MREMNVSIDGVKDRVKRLKGIELKMVINRGRNRFISIDGVIKDVYPNVFTVETNDSENEIYTFSYSDIMTKNIKFFKRDNNS